MGLRWRNAGYAVLLVAAGLIVWWVVYRDPAALTTEIYDLGDLLHGLPLRRPLRAVQPAAVFNRANDVDEDDWKGIVQTIVGPASGSDHGGLGAAYRVGDSLVVLQSAENHALILEFFQSIRASRATLAGLDLSSTEGDVQVVEILTGRLANVDDPVGRAHAAYLLGRADLPRELVVPHLERTLAALDPASDAGLHRIVCRSRVNWGTLAAAVVNALSNQLEGKLSLARRQEILFSLGQFASEAEPALVNWLGRGTLDEQRVVCQTLSTVVPRPRRPSPACCDACPIMMTMISPSSKRSDKLIPRRIGRESNCEIGNWIGNSNFGIGCRRSTS